MAKFSQILYQLVLLESPPACKNPEDTIHITMYVHCHRLLISN